MSIFGTGANQVPLNGYLGDLAYLNKAQVINTGKILAFGSTVVVKMEEANIFFLDATAGFTLEIDEAEEFKVISIIIRNTSENNVTITLGTSVYKHIDTNFVVTPAKMNVYTIMRANGVYILAAVDELGV